MLIHLSIHKVLKKKKNNEEKITYIFEDGLN